MKRSAVVVGLLLLAGCSIRIGAYTIDEAVREHGAPQEMRQAADGSWTYVWFKESSDETQLPNQDQVTGELKAVPVVVRSKRRLEMVFDRDGDRLRRDWKAKVVLDPK